MLLQACSDDINIEGNGTGDVPFEPSMVLFSAGNADNTITRASIPYMEQDGRFVCKMYYHSKTDDTDTSPYDVALPEDHGTHITSWLKVNNTVGNCIYWNPEYTDVAADKQNEYGEKAAQAFYWQNRLTHAFLAVADFNQLKTNKASTGLTMPFDDYVREVTTNDSHTIDTPVKYVFDDGTEYSNYFDLRDYYLNNIKVDDTYVEHHVDDLGTGYTSPELASDGYYYRWSNWMRHYYDSDNSFIYRIQYRVTVEKVKLTYYARQYDLTKATKTIMAQQPDPIQALTLKKPEGATQEANRVRLYFKHQFSQIQVNLKNSEDKNDIPVEPEDILSVELLGVTRKGYVYVNLNEDGTVHPTDFEQVNEKTIAPWKEPYGTEFGMFDRTLTTTETDLGYIKSYEAIAFGRLEGIRIKWKEADADGVTGVTHNVIFQIPDDDLKTLQSGVRYIYNLELRRGTLALIRTVIKDWAVDENDYSTDGTISN